MGGVDWSSRITALFGPRGWLPGPAFRARFAWAARRHPGQRNHPAHHQRVTQELTVSLVDPAANPTELSAAPARATLTAASGSATAQAALAIDLGGPQGPHGRRPFFPPIGPRPGWKRLSFREQAPRNDADRFRRGLRAGRLPRHPGDTISQRRTATRQHSYYVRARRRHSGAAIGGIANSATYRTALSPGMVVAVFGANLAGATDTASGSPLPYSLDGVSAAVNGIAAPLVYVSPTQVNLQIPYEVGAGPAVLGITNNGQVGGFQLQISAAAPGILADVDGNLSPFFGRGSGREPLRCF